MTCLPAFHSIDLDPTQWWLSMIQKERSKMGKKRDRERKKYSAKMERAFTLLSDHERSRAYFHQVMPHRSAVNESDRPFVNAKC